MFVRAPPGHYSPREAPLLEKARLRRAHLKREGSCLNCMAEARPNRTRCFECLRRIARAAKERYWRRKRGTT